ncbi:MAG: long-chain fatty acid--CoA ligase [Parabacteroides sp.]|jgi:long-chain acyl-CoA synthetase|nr:long-chain fatty acid--CoA ligase [Parabacteroides sp.]MBP8759555.1 long-chain fatty acid--CoA ligase [Parabacteroides sp.]MBP9480250.1 long-chain fatty acid--CoA ligase [Parabacteroides sp.]MBP9578021.1 long-chain fatty acid--CoA ligase [Parabacteroides sp.]MDD2416335.1 long-chain fatty acid--CoA ligase [Parabacteroides sp.]
MSYYHFAEIVHRQADKYGTRIALKYRNNDTSKWMKISWREFADKVMLTAEAMAEFGIGVQENIGVYSQNMRECLYTDFGAYANRAVPIPLYATSSPAQIEYIVKDADIHTLFVGEQLQYNNAFKVQQITPGLTRLIIFDSAVKMNPEDKTSIYFDDFLRLGNNAQAEATVKVRMKEASEDDLATIMYTSGTTGEPKGVLLHHSNFMQSMRIHEARLPEVTDKDTSMCFLPLTHIFEKAWVAFCIYRGVKIAINKDPKMIQQTLPEIHPTLMCNVPRFWEKVYVGVQEKINNSPGLIKSIFNDAIKTGRLYNLEYKNKSITPPLSLELKFNFYNKTVFAMLKRVLGLERGKLFPVAGAPLSDSVNEFLQSVNIPIRYGYGLSETTATVCFFPAIGYTLGSIGTIMPEVEVKIDPSNSEILVKGKTVTAGYFKKPEANEKAFTEDGWFRTGDAGRLEGDVLYFTERIKDLYKTSNGKYIAPQAIEMLLGSDKYIEQIAVIGDERKFVSAIIIPNFPMVEAYANQKGLAFDNREELIANPEVIRLIESRVEEHQRHLASYEKIKKFTLLAEPFTMENRELTDTLKLRRRVISEKYAAQIEAMYQE